MVPSYLFGYYINLLFWYLLAVRSTAIGDFLCGFYVAFNMLKLVADIPIMKKAAVSIYCSALSLLIFSI
jgi:hypothetical protein